MCVFLGSMHQNGSLGTWEESWYVRPKIIFTSSCSSSLLIFILWGFTMIMYRSGRPSLLFDILSALELGVCNVLG